MDHEKKPTKKSLYYRKRCFGMTGLERIQVKEKRQIKEKLQKVMIRIGDESGSDLDEIFDDLNTLQEGIAEEIRQ